jgi:hypothetical protein
MARRFLVLAAAFAAVLAFAGSGDAADPAADPGMVRVDIYRPENNSLMNSIGCLITIAGDPAGGFCHEVVRGEANRQMSGGTTTVLLGGDRVICEIKPGVSVQAFTPRALRPDGASPESRSWAARTLEPHARAGEAVEVGVVPKTRGRTYLGGWLLVQEPHAATQKRAQDH